MGVHDLFSPTKAPLFSAQLRGKPLSLSEWSIKLSPLSSLLAHRHVWDGWWIPVIIQCVGMRLHEVQKTFSLLQSPTSHDSSEIILIRWFAAQETCTIIINVGNSCAAYYYKILWWEGISKEQHLFEIVIFCKIIHVFNVTFDQFYLNKLTNQHFGCVSRFPKKIH